jgi:hypothetical protein
MRLCAFKSGAGKFVGEGRETGWMSVEQLWGIPEAAPAADELVAGGPVVG